MRNKSTKGFTLIELMIVVAIIGILAAIAIPNFLRFQLKSKSSEGKVNLAAIRTAEESYFAEYGLYVPVVSTPGVALGPQKVPFAPAPGAATPFDVIGWSPEGDVFFTYAVQISGQTGYTADAMADIDGDGNNQIWGYVHPESDGTTTVGGTLGCPAAGTLDFSVTPPVPGLFNTVGPCAVGHGQSIF